MKNKLENLISFDDFKSSWKTEQVAKTKRTKTGLDIKENVEEIIPEGLPDEELDNVNWNRPASTVEDDPRKTEYYELDYDGKIQKIKDFIDSELGDEVVEKILNELREVLLEMEQQGFVDEETTDELDDKHDGDWKSWIKDVIELPDFPEEGLNNSLQIIADIEDMYKEFEDEDEYEEPEEVEEIEYWEENDEDDQ